MPLNEYLEYINYSSTPTRYATLSADVITIGKAGAAISFSGTVSGVPSLNSANTFTALQTIKPSTSTTAIALLGEQTTSSTAMVNIIYTSTDGNGLVAGTYPFIQATAGTDTFIGVQAGNSNTGTAAAINGNVGIGYQALFTNTTGIGNVGVGSYALYSNTTGAYNTVVGYEALSNYKNTTGTQGNMVAIGFLSGDNYTGSETNDIVIGNVYGIAGESNVVRIGTSIQLGTSTQTTLTGTTAGSIVWSQPFQSGSYKKFIGYASGYENTTATAQTITYPTAFTETPIITANGTGMTLSASTTALTLPASMGATVSGFIIIEGF